MYERFLLLINKKGITAYKVSKDTGISNTTLSAWKKGSISISPKKLEQLANYFNVSIDYLMGRTDNPAPIIDYSKNVKEKENVLDSQEVYLIELFKKVKR